VLLLLAPPATAHSQLQASDPRSGARLDAAPAMVTLTLTEPVDPAGTTVTVTDSAGHRVDKDDLQVDAGPTPVLRLHLKDGLPPGAYAINWRALSGTDGHHTEGTVGFAVGSFTPPASGSASVNHIDPAAAASRALLYSGFGLAFGALAFLAWLRKAGASDTLARGALAWGTALHLAGTLLLVDRTVAAGLAWSALGGSDVGRVLLLRLFLGAGAWLLAMLAQARPTRTGPWAAGLLLLGAAVGSARLGHGSGDGPVTIALDLLHLLSASTWVGSLALLGWTLWRRKADDPAVLRALGIRYGTLAMACVALLWATGSIVALAVLGRDAVLHPGATVQSAYGAFLLGKMALAVLMLLLAGVNRYVFLEPAGAKGLAGAVQKAAHRASRGRLAPAALEVHEMRRAVAAEALLGVVVLVLAGFLTSVSPPQAAAAAIPGQTVLVQQGDTYLVHLTLPHTAHVGDAGVLGIAIEEAATGKVLANNTCGRASCIDVEVGYLGTNGTEHHAPHLLGSSWAVHDLVWTRAGTATIRVSIASADVFHDEVTFQVPVAA
jgi:copper transport protein